MADGGGLRVLRPAVQANVEYTGNQKYKVEIEKAAVYLFDIFDFYDGSGALFSQWLGCWTKYDVSSMCPTFLVPIPIEPPSFNLAHQYSVKNSSYRDYRKRWGKGGDFFIFSSDSRTVQINPAVAFTVEAK